MQRERGGRYCVRTLSIAVCTLTNMDDMDSPNAESEPIAVTTTSAPIRPYSTAVAPDSSRMSLLQNLTIPFTFSYSVEIGLTLPKSSIRTVKDTIAVNSFFMCVKFLVISMWRNSAL